MTETATRVATLWARELPLDDPILSPVYADLRDLPPTVIHVGSAELFRSDSELMAARLVQAGVRCDLHIWQGQMHAFALLAGLLPEARTAVRETAAFLTREALHSKTGRPAAVRSPTG